MGLTGVEERARAVRLSPAADGLATGLQCRLQRAGDAADLARAIALGEEALVIAGAGSAERPRWALRRAMVVPERYERLGRMRGRR